LVVATGHIGVGLDARETRSKRLSLNMFIMTCGGFAFTEADCIGSLLWQWSNFNSASELFKHLVRLGTAW